MRKVFGTDELDCKSSYNYFPSSLYSRILYFSSLSSRLFESLRKDRISMEGGGEGREGGGKRFNFVITLFVITTTGTRVISGETWPLLLQLSIFIFRTIAPFLSSPLSLFPSSFPHRTINKTCQHEAEEEEEACQWSGWDVRKISSHGFYRAGKCVIRIRSHPTWNSSKNPWALVDCSTRMHFNNPSSPSNSTPIPRF